MKKNLLFLFFIALPFISFSKGSNIASMDFVSEEVSHVNGVFEFKIKITANQDFALTMKTVITIS